MFLLMKRWTDKGHERHTTTEQESEALKNVCCLQRKKKTLKERHGELLSSLNPSSICPFPCTDSSCFDFEGLPDGV